MADLVSAISSIGPLIQQLGIAGVLAVIIYFLLKEIMRLRSENAHTYRERDAYRLGLERCRGVNNLLRQRLGEPIDETDLDDYVHGLLKEQVET